MSKNEDFYCLGCKKTHKKSAFYLSENEMHDGVLPFCKNYIKDYVTKNDGGVDIEKFQSLLMQMDKPFIIELWESAINGDREPVGSYIQKTAVYHNRKLTWRDSIFGENVTYTENGFPRNENYPELSMFWGNGFEDDEYAYLEDKLDEYMEAYDADSPVVIELFKQASLESLEIRRKRERREDVSKNLKNLQDIMGSANIKPAQVDESQSGKESFGTLIKKWENEKPIPEALDEWKDADYIEKYIKTWFFGHLAKMVGGYNPNQKEYDDTLAENTVEFEEQQGGD